MTRKRTKDVISQAPPPLVPPPADREALIAAYQAGLITAWKHHGERVYRLTMSGRQDEYVEAAKLSKHLARLASASRSPAHMQRRSPNQADTPPRKPARIRSVGRTGDRRARPPAVRA